jgi:hypothetical protein
MMKKRRNPKGTVCVPIQNPVAKYAHLFNKAQTFCDKSKYSRKTKHSNQGVSPIALISDIGKTPFFYFSSPLGWRI